MALSYITCLFYISVIVYLPLQSSAYVTQTVYGFLDFTTTIGDTVMVFSPHSAPALNLDSKAELSDNTIKTEPLTPGNEKEISPTKHSSYNVASGIKSSEEPKSFSNSSSSSLTKVLVSSSSGSHISSQNSATFIESNFNRPEYDFLSRQPVEFAEESYRLISHKPSFDETSAPYNNKRQHENRKNKKPNEHAQVITHVQSEKHSQAVQSSVSKNKSPIRPSSSLRILKTASPSSTKTSISPSGLGSRTTHTTKRPRKNYANKPPSNDVVETETKAPAAEKPALKKGRSRNKSKRRNKSSTKITETSTRRPLRSKIQASSVETDIPTSLLMLKLNRTPGRWQYKTSPKPRVSIRKALSEVATSTESGLSTATNNLNLESSNPYLENGDLESSGSQNGPVLNNVNPENKQIPPAETLNVEISTPEDFKSVYYEIATIKTPYIFQVGLLKKTRFITVTSTIEKTIPVEPTVSVDNKPLIENILTSSLDIDQTPIESSITYLSPIYLDSNAETPSLETVVETLSTTLTKLKTQVLPFIRQESNETSYTTLIQTYDVTTIIAATKTISPMDDNHFVASRNFKDFSVVLDEAGSELNLELEFGDTDNAEVLNGDKQFVALSELPAKRESKVEPSLNTFINEDQKQQLALMNTPKLSTIITTSHSYVVPETLWESHVIPITNGGSTVYRTLSKSIGTVDKTHYKVESSTVLLPNVQPPQISVNPFLLHQEFQTVTSPIVQQTTVQQTNSKVLKLTFGAKTAYTTIYSTSAVPTVLTMFVTTAIPVQPTAAFPGYFAPPFHPFQFVG